MYSRTTFLVRQACLSSTTLQPFLIPKKKKKRKKEKKRKEKIENTALSCWMVAYLSDQLLIISL